MIYCCLSEPGPAEVFSEPKLEAWVEFGDFFPLGITFGYMPDS